MTRVLVTAFEPYGRWRENASWLCLVELTRQLPVLPELTTRRYPVDFAEVRRCLEADLAENYDFAIHLGQSTGGARLGLEAFAINAGIDRDDRAAGNSASDPPELTTNAVTTAATSVRGAWQPRAQMLDATGPAAYQTSLPLDDWCDLLNTRGIPARVSHHAGTYLCNATLYLSHLIAERSGLKTQSAFIHLPLATSQVAAGEADAASLPAELAADGVRHIIEEMHRLSASK
ncbi:MAG: hypothetical protein KDA63_10190 [Planctomycetales bacterium]|nr:hypothetical protein [Planctomycetales bacterium]